MISNIQLSRLPCWQRWNLMWSADVTDPPQVSMFCVGWDAFLLSMVVNSDYLVTISFWTAGHFPLTSFNNKAFPSTEHCSHIFVYHTNLYFLLCVKFPGDQQFLKYWTITEALDLQLHDFMQWATKIWLPHCLGNKINKQAYIKVDK